MGFDGVTKPLRGLSAFLHDAKTGDVINGSRPFENHIVAFNSPASRFTFVFRPAINEPPSERSVGPPANARS